MSKKIQNKIKKIKPVLVQNQPIKEIPQISPAAPIQSHKRNLTSFIKSQFTSVYGRKRLIFFTILISSCLYLFWGIPLPINLANSQPVSTKILDRNGKLIYEIYTDKRRAPVNLSELPKYVKEATISIEDKDFYKHKGLSYSGIARALYSTIFKHSVQG